MSIFNRYDEEIAVLPLPITVGGFERLDLAPFFPGETPLAVTLRVIRGGAAGSHSFGLRNVNDNLVFISKIIGSLYLETIVGLDGGTEIEYLQSIGNEIQLFITGEVRSPAVIHSPAIFMNQSEDAGWADWRTVQVTTLGDDLPSDVSAVIVKTIDFGLGATFGVKHPDASIANLWPSEWEGGQHWWVVGVNANGNYEINTTGPAGSDNEHIYFFEIGYIKHGTTVNTITDPLLEGEILPALAHPDYAVLDFSDTLPPRVKTVGGHWWNSSAPNRRGFLKASGSSNPSRIVVGGQTIASNAANLDSELRCEYRRQSGARGYYIQWYESLIEEGASIRRINDEELMSASLRIDPNVTTRLKAIESTSASIRQETGSSIRRIRTEELTSAKLRVVE